MRSGWFCLVVFYEVWVYNLKPIKVFKFSAQWQWIAGNVKPLILVFNSLLFIINVVQLTLTSPFAGKVVNNCMVTPFTWRLLILVSLPSRLLPQLNGNLWARRTLQAVIEDLLNHALDPQVGLSLIYIQMLKVFLAFGKCCIWFVWFPSIFIWKLCNKSLIWKLCNKSLRLYPACCFMVYTQT